MSFLRLLLPLLASLACLAPLPAQPPAPPSGKDILASLRLSQAGGPALELKGRIRGDSGPGVPFVLRSGGGQNGVTYTFPAAALTLRVTFTDKAAKLTEEKGGASSNISGARLAELIPGTNISYEDLGLCFIYWPTAEVRGQEVILTRTCWKLRVLPGSSPTQYSGVFAWIDSGSGALLRAECYDRIKGGLAKRFEIRSSQKWKDTWLLKQMRIQGYAPGNPSKIVSRTYLEIEKPAN